MKSRFSRRSAAVMGVVAVGVAGALLVLASTTSSLELSVGQVSLVLGVSLLVGAVVGWLWAVPTDRSTERLIRIARQLEAGGSPARARLRPSDALFEMGETIDGLVGRLEERGASSATEGERHQTIFDAMAEAVFVTDRQGRVVLANTRLNELIDGTTEGRTATEVIRHPRLHEAIELARNGESQDTEFELQTVRGVRDLRAYVSPIARSGGVVAVLHDVTAERMADRVRRDFVANASHELRTPLTAIRGFAETLRDGSPSGESRDRFIELILKHTSRLEALVEDLSVLSRAESGADELVFTKVDLGQALGEVLDSLSAGVTRNKLTIERSGMEEALPVRVDERALDQVLVNLVDNAVKYTPEGGAITIRARLVAPWVELDIGNTGPGVPASQLPRIFERFYRVDAGRSREIGGTGLGLSIVKHRVAQLGGDIDAESEPGSWTRFRLRLPAAE